MVISGMLCATPLGSNFGFFMPFYFRISSLYSTDRQTERPKEKDKMQSAVVSGKPQNKL